MHIFMTALSCLTCVLLDSKNGRLLSVYKDTGHKASRTVVSMLDGQQQVRVVDYLYTLAHANICMRNRSFEHRLTLEGLLTSGNVFAALFKL